LETVDIRTFARDKHRSVDDTPYGGGPGMVMRPDVVAAAVDSGTCVEVSSQGLRKPAAEVYPAPEFLRRFFEAGVAITLASDGHVASEAGDGHDEVVAAARAAGYTTHVRFDRRARTDVPL